MRDLMRPIAAVVLELLREAFPEYRVGQIQRGRGEQIEVYKVEESIEWRTTVILWGDGVAIYNPHSVPMFDIIPLLDYADPGLLEQIVDKVRIELKPRMHGLVLPTTR